MLSSQNIYSLTELRDYILVKLGSPVISVEITPAQLDICISDTIQLFSEFALDGQLDKVLILDLIPGVNQYILDEKISAVMDVKTHNQGSLFGHMQIHGEYLTQSEYYANPLNPRGNMDLQQLQTVMSKISLFENFFNVSPNYNYSDTSKTLSFTDNLSSNKLLLEVSTRLDVDEEYDTIFNNFWIKAYSTALAKFQWASNVGKYNSELIGGATINHEILKAEAIQEISELKEQLMNEYVQPYGVLRG